LNSPNCRPDGDITHRTGLWKSRRPIENERFSACVTIVCVLSRIASTAPR
jgi:hypothetical protein